MEKDLEFLLKNYEDFQLEGPVSEIAANLMRNSISLMSLCEDLESLAEEQPENKQLQELWEDCKNYRPTGGDFSDISEAIKALGYYDEGCRRIKEKISQNKLVWKP